MLSSMYDATVDDLKLDAELLQEYGDEQGATIIRVAIVALEERREEVIGEVDGLPIDRERVKAHVQATADEQGISYEAALSKIYLNIYATRQALHDELVGLDVLLTALDNPRGEG
jgi:hypothetical protein